MMFVLWEDIFLKKVVWSSVITTTGGLCVMTPGMRTMLALFAGSWDSLLIEQDLSVKPGLVRALALSGWMRLGVLELRADWLTVLPMLLVPTTVHIVKMLESVANQVCNAFLLELFQSQSVCALVLLTCPLLGGLSSFRVSFIRGFTVSLDLLLSEPTYFLLDCSNNDVRLVDGANRAEGRVEFCYNNDWGTVCDDSWGTTDASVVCRQLGFVATGATAFSNAEFGQGTGPILLDGVNCVGTESRLADCPANPIGNHDCSHGEDAGVRCTPSTFLKSECVSTYGLSLVVRFVLFQSVLYQRFCCKPHWTYSL